MIDISWVEIILVGILAGTFALSVGFCMSNYARSERLQLAERDNE